MASNIPLISLPSDTEPLEGGTIDCHTDVEDVSNVDEEVASHSLGPKTHHRRKHHKCKARGKVSAKGATALLAADDEDDGPTDTEVVELDNDLSDEGNFHSIEDLPLGIFDALKPKIVEISDDKDGKLVIKTLVKNVAVRNAADDSEDSEVDSSSRNMLRVRQNHEAVTDVESLSSEIDETDARSEGDVERALQQYDYGRLVDTKLEERQKKEKSCIHRRKPRKCVNRKKARSVENTPFLVVSAEEAEQLTDVEYLAEDIAEKVIAESSSEAEMAHTDVEDMTEQKTVTPMVGIFVTSENGDVGSSADYRSATKSLGGNLLGLPQEDEAPVTDVEDVDVEDTEVRRITSGATPKNGPSLAAPARQVINILVEENGTQVVTNTTSVSPYLRVETADEDAATDSEYLGVSADEDEGRRFSITPDIEMFQGSTVDVKDSEQRAGSNMGLLPPVSAAEALTDCEDMDVSDAEEKETEEYQSQDPAVFEQYETSYSTVQDSGDYALASEPAAFESAQRDDMV